MTPRAPLIAAAATLALLCGCASAPATRYYVLAATADAPARRAATAVAVVIKDVRLPQYLARPQIVTRGSDHRVRMAEHEQWAGDLHQDLMRVLTENLGRLLESDRVIAAPHTLRLQPDYRVEVEILRFERDAGGRVQLSARWWLTRGSDAALLESPQTTLLGAQLGESAAYEALIASMSSVYGELAQMIARSIRARAAAGA